MKVHQIALNSLVKWDKQKSHLDSIIDTEGMKSREIALCYQLGVLIFPPLVPVILWVLANWALIEQFTGLQGKTKS